MIILTNMKNKYILYNYDIVYYSLYEENIMKLSLRKANQLRKTLEKHLKDLTISHSIMLNVSDSNAINKFNSSVELFEKSINDKIMLYNILYSIRTIIMNENNVSGINDILANIETIKKCINEYTIITKLPIIDPSSIEIKLSNLSKRLDAGNSYQDEISVSLLTIEIKNVLDNIISELKRNLGGLEDKLAELNSTNSINIDDKDIEYLNSVGIY